MPTVSVYNQKGEQVGTQTLNPNIFGVGLKDAVIHQVAVSMRHNLRSPIAHTKGRGDVAGGGRKPWKQKGTGRARHGSIRSPLWVGGGVTFGPTNARRFNHKVNKKVKTQATKMMLSDKVRQKRFCVLDTLALERPKTKLFVQLLGRLPIAEKKTLVAVDRDTRAIIRASRNIQCVKVVDAASVGVLDLLSYPYFMITASGLEKLEKRFL